MDAGGKRLGQMLTEVGLVTEAQLAEALERQKREGGKLASQLVKLGHLDTDTLLEFLRLQFGVAAVNLDHYRIPESVLALVPAELARKHHVIPVNVLEKSLTLAMEDPRDAAALEAVAEFTGLRAEPLICPSAVIEQALGRFYPLAAQPAEAAVGRVISLDEKTDSPAVFNPRESPKGLSALNWLKRIIFFGIKHRSREIHLEPREGEVLVRYRTGAKLAAGDTLPRPTAAAVGEMLLSAAGFGGREGAGEGWVRVRVKGRELKMVYSSFPVIHGNRIVLKLADEVALRQPLSELGLEAAEERRMTAVLEKGRGLFLIVSPSEQQRQWAMYHLVDLLKRDNLNVITVESRLLMPLPGISQTLYGGREGAARREVLEAALRQEPDILAVADMGDYELLETVLEASAQSLVLGALPLVDTLRALAWLSGGRHNRLSLAYLLGGSLSLRFLPKLCLSCRRRLEYPPEIPEGVRELHPSEMRFQESPGCQKCDGTGRAGMLGAFELFIPDEEVRELIASGAPSRVVWEEAQRRGMRTLLEDGLLKAAGGLVDPRDVLRTAPPEPEGEG